MQVLTKDEMNAVLAKECEGKGYDDTVDDYTEGSFVLFHDGERWEVLEDSVETAEEAEAMAKRAEREYGEIMAVYHRPAD